MLMLILFATGLFAGTVDAIAGGGGLISLPILLGMGMPPHIAFGTNKLQSTIGTLVATRRYYRHGLIAFEIIYTGIIFGLLGSVLGAWAGQVVGNETLRKIIPILLSLVFIYTLLSPRFGSKDEKPRMNQRWFYMLFGFGLGFYDGFFGPGTGSIWVFLLTYMLGYNLIKATAYTKLFNFNSSFIATICFAFGGNIDYRVAFVMAIGQLIGARIGAHLAIKNGARLIRPLYLCVVSMTIVVLVYKTYSSSPLFAQLTEQFGILPQIVCALSIFIGLAALYARLMRKKLNY